MAMNKIIAIEEKTIEQKFMEAIESNPAYQSALVELGKYDKAKGKYIKHEMAHYVETTNLYVQLLCVLKEYSRLEDVNKSIPYVLASLFHGMTNAFSLMLGPVSAYMGDSNSYSKVSDIINKYQENRKYIDALMQKTLGHPELAWESLKVSLSQRVFSYEEFLLYVADAMSSIQSPPHHLTTEKDLMYVSTLAQIMDSFSKDDKNDILSIWSKEMMLYVASKTRRRLHDSVIMQMKFKYKVANFDDIKDYLKQELLALHDEFLQKRVKAQGSFRVKELGSLVENFETTNPVLNENFDVLAMRFIVDSEGDVDICLRDILEKYNINKDSVIKRADGTTKKNIEIFIGSNGCSDTVNKWLKDGIIDKKNIKERNNNYQDVHVIVEKDGKKIEIQIRTKAQHDINENGAASHRYYKGKKPRLVSQDGSRIEAWKKFVEENRGIKVVGINGVPVRVKTPNELPDIEAIFKELYNQSKGLSFPRSSVDETIVIHGDYIKVDFDPSDFNIQHSYLPLVEHLVKANPFKFQLKKYANQEFTLPKSIDFQKLRRQQDNSIPLVNIYKKYPRFVIQKKSENGIFNHILKIRGTKPISQDDIDELLNLLRPAELNSEFNEFEQSLRLYQENCGGGLLKVSGEVLQEELDSLGAVYTDYKLFFDWIRDNSTQFSASYALPLIRPIDELNFVKSFLTKSSREQRLE